jgi:hypothetical protein
VSQFFYNVTLGGLLVVFRGTLGESAICIMWHWVSQFFYNVTLGGLLVVFRGTLGESAICIM